MTKQDSAHLTTKDTDPQPSVLAFESHSLGLAYRLMSECSATEMEFLEASWMANSRAFVLGQGSEQAIATAHARLLKKTEIVDLVALPKTQQILLDAYFNLLPPQTTGQTLVIELRSLPLLIKGLSECLASTPGLKLSELRPYRIVPGPALALLHGSTEDLRGAETYWQKNYAPILHDLQLVNLNF